MARWYVDDSHLPHEQGKREITNLRCKKHATISQPVTSKTLQLSTPSPNSRSRKRTALSISSVQRMILNPDTGTPSGSVLFPVRRRSSLLEGSSYSHPNPCPCPCPCPYSYTLVISKHNLTSVPEAPAQSPPSKPSAP